MESADIEKLLKENVETFNGIIYRSLKFLGISRFDTANGKIGKKSVFSICLSMFILAVIHGCNYHTIYSLSIEKSYLIYTENLILVNFLAFHTGVLINISFFNRKSAAEFINGSIVLDTFLGVDETLFMRELTVNTYFFLSVFVGFTQIVILLVLLFTYVVDISVCFSAGILFSLLYVIYYDLSLFISFYLMLTLRVRYLNVAVMKLAKMKLAYLPRQSPFNYFIWKKKYDSRVTFQNRATVEMFCQAYIAIFDQLRCLEKCYRFTILCCLIYLVVGSFISVQSWIIWAKSTDVDIFRVLAVTGWAGISWQFQLTLSQQTDMFLRQINQTKLICTYIQLKPTYTDEIYKLTGHILRTLEVRDSRISIYGLFYFDTALLLRMASTIFVYITIQLQIAFSKNRDIAISVLNNTSSIGDDDNLS